MVKKRSQESSTTDYKTTAGSRRSGSNLRQACRRYFQQLSGTPLQDPGCGSSCLPIPDGTGQQRQDRHLWNLDGIEIGIIFLRELRSGSRSRDPPTLLHGHRSCPPRPSTKRSVAWHPLTTLVVCPAPRRRAALALLSVITQSSSSISPL
jgi:hypothetical protein